MSLSVLVTGVTGYVGSTLVPRLQRDGHRIRGFARHADRVTQDIEVVEGDASELDDVVRAMEGVDVAYFLMHSMEGTGDFDEAEHAMAETFVEAGRRRGVRRVVFLGGITPEEDTEGGSEHLESRHAVEETLLGGFPEGVALRASLVIGQGSRSFDLLAALIERLPVTALPAWREHRTRPIDHRDVIEYLALAATNEQIHGGRSFDVGGATEVSYGDLVIRIGELGGNDNPTLKLPLSATPIAARVAAWVTDEDRGLIQPLMESLEHDLLPDDREARELFGVEPRDLDDMLGEALRERAEARSSSSSEG